MIDIAIEKILSPADAVRHLPRRRAGKPANLATIYRWMQTGCKGKRLESIRIGGTLCTSLEAMQRFFEALTEAAEPATASVPAPALTKARQRQIEAAEAHLAGASR